MGPYPWPRRANFLPISLAFYLFRSQVQGTVHIYEDSELVSWTRVNSGGMGGNGGCLISATKAGGRWDNLFSYKHFGSLTLDDFCVRLSRPVASGFWFKNDSFSKMFIEEIISNRHSVKSRGDCYLGYPSHINGTLDALFHHGVS